MPYLLLNIVNITPAPMSSAQAFGNVSAHEGFTVILRSFQHDGEKATGSQVGEQCCRVKKAGR